MGGSAAKERRKLKRKVENQEQSIQNSKVVGTAVQSPKNRKALFTKPKKPKHLKRKLEQCQNELDAEEIRNQMEKLQAKKLARRQKFEQSIRDELSKDGKSALINEAGFLELLDKGSSKEMLIKVAKGEIDWPTLAVKEDITDEDGLPRSTSIGHESNKDTNIIINPSLSVQAEDCKSSDEESVNLNIETTVKRRRRGRGRKDREEEDRKLAELNALAKAKAEKARLEKEQIVQRELEIENEKEAASLAKKTSKKDDKRRCIGRKPVTDFTIGERYDGHIVYIKEYGIFVDVNCHSDAFCHVSRASDDYVDSLHDTFKEGDKVNVHVLEIDRKQKRLTVTMQSEEKIRELKEKSEETKGKAKKNRNTSDSSAKGNHVKFVDETTAEAKTSEDNEEKPESEMTHAELKRKRKLERRAQRRAQQEATGIAA